MATSPRRSFLGAAAGVVAAGLLLPGKARSAPSGKPIRIGCIVSLSGSQEVLGRPILDGAQIAADEINAAGGVLGRPLQIVEGDPHTEPHRAVELAREMSADGINLLCGIITSDSALAVAATLPELNAVLIGCSSQTDKLTHEAFVPNFFRVTDQVIMRNRAQARLMAQRYAGISRWGAILPESEYGHAAWAAFRDGLLEAYPEFAKRDPALDEPVFAKFGATDFKPQIAALRDKGADGLFVAVYGDDGINFYQQALEANSFDEVKVIADSYNEFLVPQAFGGSTPVNLWLAMTWYYGGYQELPMGRALYQEYMRRTGNGLPHGLVCTGHAAVRAYAAAIAKVNSDATPQVIAGLRGLTFDTAKGPVTLRAEDHQAICDVNFIRIKSLPHTQNLDMIDFSRPDIEVAEFIRYDGASVIEPPSPGVAIVHHA